MSADLIKRLETEEGDRGLDYEIHSSLGLKSLRSQVPHYTTSLDAKLPNEQIIEVKDLRATVGWEKGFPEWSAYCLVPGKTVCVGHGHTEALARRIAALKARA